MSRALALAGGVSLLIHLAVLLSGGRPHPDWPDMQPLSAQLLPAAVNAPVPASPQSASPRTSGQGNAPRISDESALAIQPGSEAPVPAVPVDQSSAQEAPPAPVAPPVTALAPKLEMDGGILYGVYRPPVDTTPPGLIPGGEPEPVAPVRGMEIGRARHLWHFAEGRYELRSEMETSGVVALFKPYRMVVESRGRLTARGLQPESYRTWRNGRASADNIDFDWAAERARLGKSGKIAPLAPGTQDLLSLHYQLAYQRDLTAGGNLLIATPRKVYAYRVELVGAERIEIPAGVYQTLHVRVKTDSATDLWLATERQLLPVKIRYTDRKGDAYELQAIAIGKPSS